MKTKGFNLEPGGPFTAVPRPDIVMHHCVATQIELYVPDRDSYVGRCTASYIANIMHDS